MTPAFTDSYYTHHSNGADHDTIFTLMWKMKAHLIK